ncbi:hypothetical protein IW262DRAFT_1419737 [Armillaria fumosa]|nr:hypothetical protein IW262DRAFT_1419737 [Armillaria fumosa]
MPVHQPSASSYYSTQDPQQSSTMNHHKEEYDDLLLPSRPNDGLSSSASATWSEARHSSSSATLAESPPTARRTWMAGTPSVIAGLLSGAALTAVLHHVYLFILQGRTVSGQFWIKNSSNVLSMLVQWLCMGSVSVSLTQLIWWLLHRRPFTVHQLNHLFSLPNPFRILRLASSRRGRNAIPVIAMATILQGFALVSILAPNSLEIGSASPKNTAISVPTVFFSETYLDGFECDPYPSEAWQKVLGQALQSDTLFGWNAPAECGTACNYTIQYAAPALRCTELDMNEVIKMVPSNGSTITVYNATYNIDNTTVMPANISMAWRTAYDANGKPTIAGARCSLYNTTQQAVVSFANNTKNISPSIISYGVLVENEPVYWPGCGPIPDGNYAQDVGYASLTYAALLRWLYLQLQGSLAVTSEKPHALTTTSGFDTNNLFSLNETAGTFTPNSENVVTALEQILVNVTVALISSLGHTTTVNASVVQDGLVWVYHVQRLWIVYITALVVTTACGAVGLVCILKDGEEHDVTFWDIVRATRNSELDVLVEGGKRGGGRKDTMLRYAVQGKDSDMNTSGVFVLARSLHKGSSWMEMGS